MVPEPNFDFNLKSALRPPPVARKEERGEERKREEKGEEFVPNPFSSDRSNAN